MEGNTRKQNKTWRVIDLINWGKEYFLKKGFDNPRLEIEWLLQDILKCRRVDLYLRFEEPMPKPELDLLHSWIKRRLKNEPIQYITESTEFFGLKLKVKKGVFIPRPETERVVDAAIHALRKIKLPKILEIGTGSGCISIAIAHEIPVAQIKGIDVSDAALKLAVENAKLYNLKNVEFEKLNILTALPDETQYDMIVCNPPYIPHIELIELDSNVRDHEPLNALTDSKDGLSFYRRMAEIAPNILNKGGNLIMEVGLGKHPQNAQKCFEDKEFKSVELIRDYNNDERVLMVKM